ncbi:uncharacterized protein LOC144159671 [Haemaphysalis longicornis]
MTLDEAFTSGYLLSDKCAVSVPLAVERGIYDKSLKCFVHPDTQERLNVSQAVQRGIIDGFGTVVVDPESNMHIPLVRALEVGAVSVDDCSVASLPLELAICRGLVADRSKCPSGDIRDPGTGRPVGLWEAVRGGLIDAERLRVRIGEGRLVSCAEAVRLGFLDGTSGCWVGPPQLTADEALRWGFLLDSATPMPLQNALALGLYSPSAGTLHHPAAQEPRLTLQEAICEGVLEPDVLTVKVAHSGEMLSLSEAMAAGIVDPLRGTMWDTDCDVSVDLYEAAGRGWILPVAKALPLSEVVLRKFYSPVSGLILNPSCEHPQTLRDALRSGFVSATSTMVFSGCRLLPFLEAVSYGLVDDRAGVLRVNGGPIDLMLAFEKGDLLEVSPPLPLKTALSLGLFDDQSGYLVEPASGRLLTLTDALARQLVDDSSTRVLQSKGDARRTLVLSEAIACGKIDKHSSKYATDDGTLIPLGSCFKEGLVLNVQPSTPLQRLVREGSYLEDLNRFRIQGLNYTVSLTELVVRRMVDPYLPFLSQPEQEPLHLAEACRQGLVELSSGLVRDGQHLLPLSRALQDGLVIDIERPFTLVEMVCLGFCEPGTGRLLHPVEGSFLNLEESLELGTVTPRDSYVKDIHSGCFLTLTEALETGLVDAVRNRYVPQDLNLYEAVLAKMIIHAKVPLGLGQAFADLLFDEESGKFLDPRSSELLSLKEALNCGLLDKESVMQESANTSIKGGPGNIVSREVPHRVLKVQHPKGPTKGIGNLQRGKKVAKRVRSTLAAGTSPGKQLTEPITSSTSVRFASRLELKPSKGLPSVQPATESGEGIRFPLQRQLVQETVSSAELLPVIKTNQATHSSLSPPSGEQRALGDSVEELSPKDHSDEGPIFAVLAPSEVLSVPHSLLPKLPATPMGKKSAEIHDPTCAAKEVQTWAPRSLRSQCHSLPSLEFVSFAAVGSPHFTKFDHLYGVDDQLQAKKRDEIVKAVICQPSGSPQVEERAAVHLKEQLEPDVQQLTPSTDSTIDQAVKSGVSHLPPPAEETDECQSSDATAQPSGTDDLVMDSTQETAENLDFLEPVKAVCKVAFHTEFDRATNVTRVRPGPSSYVAKGSQPGKKTKAEPGKGEPVAPDPSRTGHRDRCPLGGSRQEHSVIVHVEAADDGIDAVRVEIAENRPMFADDWQGDAVADAAASRAVVHLQQHFGMEKAVEKDFPGPRKRHPRPPSSDSWPTESQSPFVGLKPGQSSFQASDDSTWPPQTDVPSPSHSLGLPSDSGVPPRTEQVLHDKREAVTSSQVLPAHRAGDGPRTGLPGQVVHPSPLSFDGALLQGDLCPRTGQVTDRECKKTLTLAGASRHGYLDPSSFLVKDTLGKRVLSLQEAVQEGILDAASGTVLAATDRGCISFGDALARRIFVSPRSPLPLSEAVEYGVYRPAEGLLLCPWTGRWLPVDEDRLPPWIGPGMPPSPQLAAESFADLQASQLPGGRSRMGLSQAAQDRVRGVSRHCTTANPLHRGLFSLPAP